VALALAAVVIGGCASFPRIDPSGERFLIWPNQSATSTVPPPASLPALPPLAGNQAAPPAVGAPAVGSSAASDGGFCPLCPFCNLNDGACCFCRDSDPNPAAASLAAAPGSPSEKMQVTPSRVLAPVGSEVVVRAGVCADDGYLRTNRRVNWMLGPQGTGQFVTVGEEGEMDMLRLPWDRPAKHDNAYAVGYTSPYHTCLHRGTADATDDVQVRPGDAWITVSSSTEGVSYVTAHAPESENWEARRGSAVIYWIDAQWALAPSASVQPGQSHTLVTTVTRQSDGAPVAGWLVKYEVTQGSPARLGYEAGQTVEVATDASGRASVAVTPTDDQPGTAVIEATVVRPAQSGTMPAPRLEVGGGESVVTWSPLATGGSRGIIVNPAPSLPNELRPPAPFVPAPGEPGGPVEPAARAPRLEVTVSRDGSGPVRVGDVIPLTIAVKNTGEAPATGIVVFDRFDPGLTSDLDTQARGSIRYDRMPTLAPGQQDSVKLELKATAAGRQCHEVSVTADGADRAFERQCFDVDAPLPPAAPKLRIETAGEARRVVNDLFTFKARIINSGAAAAKDVRVEVLNSPELAAELATDGHVPITGGVAFKLPTIPPGPNGVPIEVKYRCRTAAPLARVTVYVKADGVEEFYETRGVEIVPAQAGGAPSGSPPAPGAGGPTPPAPAVPPTLPSGPLVGSLSSTASPIQTGASGILNVTVTNTGTTTLNALDFRVVAPASIRLRPQQTSPKLNAREYSGVAHYDVIPQLAAGQSIRLALPFDATAPGAAEVRLEMRSPDVPSGAVASTTVQVLPR
jgi:uncharacterized repeat protein (TIGR01451 family)